MPRGDHGLPKKQIDFASWGELLDYASRPEAPLLRDCRASRSPFNIEWSGTETWDGALELARNGWTEAEDKARALSSAMFESVSSLVERDYCIADVEGQSIDIAAFCKGEPEVWQRWERVTEQGQGNKIVRIVINGFYSAGIDHDAIIARGAVISALIELLEYAGTRCEVIHHTPFNGSIHFRTLIKSADQPLDLSRLIFAAGHPSMFRRIMFSCLEQNPQEHKSETGYGSPFTLDRSQQGDVYFDHMGYGDPQWSDPSQAKAWILAELKRQGVALDPA